MAQTTVRGVDFPALDGRRSSSDAGRSILADAARAIDPELAERIGAARDWRGGYLRQVRDLTAAGARHARAPVDVAGAGLRAAHGSLVFDTGGREVPLGDALAEQPATDTPGSATVSGTASPEAELAVPYRGERLAGTALAERLDEWVSRGIVEPSFAAAIREVAANPGWLALEGWTVVVLGAGAELGPLEPLTRWGADVIAVDVPRPDVWRRILATATSGAGTVTLPVRGDGSAPDPDRAGLDLVQELPEVRAWLEDALGGRRAVLGTYAYADGAAHVRVSAAADALAGALLEAREDTALAYLGTPTDCYLVEPDVVQEARARWRGRGVKALLQAPLRRSSREKLFVPSYASLAEGEDGRQWGVADVLVPQQGPNYALAKRLQRWRALHAAAAGRRVSFNVAPASWTRSVTKNRILAAAYAGAHHFGVEIFRPETARTLMAALLVRDLQRPATADGDLHPEQRISRAAAHGGLWRAAYEPRTVLSVAAVAGLPRALRPGG